MASVKLITSKEVLCAAPDMSGHTMPRLKSNEGKLVIRLFPALRSVNKDRCYLCRPDHKDKLAEAEDTCKHTQKERERVPVYITLFISL